VTLLCESLKGLQDENQPECQEISSKSFEHVHQCLL
jgi:hypothetical protein